ncbi:Stm1 protein [Saccharomycopsis crataegensis]|uniref:Stm1 protein n=1 Tax=Saccharomycopsis crataegensis TaxID=43959 RepID=A0AAV5QR08_9ASCO|nr:Stm1 protein [Saccharomycopsis crataegensis]
MSTNPFDLLGNDVEDDTQVASIPKELVKKSTSSKKKDVPPPSADKKRASKNGRPSLPANEAAVRDKSVGRGANRARSTDAPAGAKKGGKPKSTGPNDRKSRTGKTDSAKKLKQAGWTGEDGERELQTEEAAAEDVTEEVAAEEAAEEAKGPAKKSLQEYLAEIEAQKEATASTTASSRTIEALVGEKIEKKEEVFFNSTVAKKEKQKARKEKQTLDISAVFSDELPFERRSGAPRRGGARGGARGGKKSAGRKPAAAKGAVLDDKNFPSLG